MLNTDSEATVVIGILSISRVIVANKGIKNTKLIKRFFVLFISFLAFFLTIRSSYIRSLYIGNRDPYLNLLLVYLGFLALS